MILVVYILTFIGNIFYRQYNKYIHVVDIRIG